MNRLPSEFLYQLSNYLTLQDCYNCLAVCKFWRNAFKRILYRVVHIYSDQQLQQFMEAVKYNGQLVKEIYLHNNIQYNETMDYLEDLDDPHYINHIHLSQTHFESLSMYCPQLEVLQFDKHQWNHLILSNVISNWDHISNLPPIQHQLLPHFFPLFKSPYLTHLNIDFAFDPIENDSSHFTSLLNQVSSLQHLTLEIFYKQQQHQIMDSAPLNISNLLQQIHTALPNLKSLEFICTNPPRHEPPAAVYESNNILASFKEKSSLKSLTVQGHIDSIKWFAFIYENYPELEELKIIQMATSRFGTKWMWQQALVDLIRNLRCMKSLTIGGRNAPQLLSKGLALELKSPTCAVENLYIDFKTYQAIESCQFLLIIAAFGLKQLKFLRLRVWEQTPGWSGVTFNLFQCRQLVSLELSLSKGLMDQYPFTPFLIDNFLENMPQLEELTLVGAEIQVLYKHLEDLDIKTVFSLHSLTLIQSRVQNHPTVFSYLSKCCPRLNQLCFRRCEVTKNVKQLTFSPSPACITNDCTLDMPYTRFEKIYLSSFLIYTGTVETIEYIGIRILSSLASSENGKIAWCRIAGLGGSFIYPQYTTVEDADVLSELQNLYQNSDIMPGNYVPSIGIITIRCKSVSDIYLDNVKIPRKSFYSFCV